MASGMLYAAPRIAGVSLFAPINIVQGVYAKHYGLPLTTIASVILIARIFDAITDPVIGYLSDKSRIKYGSRKPTMLLGAIIFSCSGYFLYTPPNGVDAFYFTFWFVAFYLGFTLFEIPHLAWGGEISKNTEEKTKIFTLRTMAGVSGVLMFYGIPLLPIWQTTEITPDTLEFSAVASCVLLVPLLYLCLKKVPNGHCYGEGGVSDHKDALASSVSPFDSLSSIFISVIKNKPLLTFFSAFVFSGVGLGIWLGVLFIYVDVYLGAGELFPKIYLTALIVSIPGAMLWVRVAKLFGKRNAWLLAMLFGVMSFAYSGFLDPQNAGYWTLSLLLIINSLCFVCMESLPHSMLSDIIDYSSWKFRTYSGSTYFALFQFIYKAAYSIGFALGLAVLDWYEFDPSATIQTGFGLTGIKMTMTWLPILFVVVSMIFVAASPISGRRHEIIRRRLQSIEYRSKRDAAGVPETGGRAKGRCLVPSTSHEK